MSDDEKRQLIYMREADGATRRKVFAPITPDLEVFFLKD